MFKAISNLWRVARGTELFKQVDEMASKSIPALQGQAVTRFIATILSEMPALREKTGNFAHVSKDGRKQMASALFSEARKRFDLDVGRGTALALIAIYVEASALPGPDAGLAHTIAGQLIDGIEKGHAEAKVGPPHSLKGDTKALFDLQCKYGESDIVPGRAVVALVLDATKEFGTSVPIKIEADGRQLAVIKVIAPDGGFIVPAWTPGGGEHLRVDDLVMWVPTTWAKQVADISGDPRAGWVGLIRAKIKPDIPLGPGNSWEFICRYD